MQGFFPQAPAELDNLQAYIDKYEVNAELLDLKVPMKTSDLAAEQLSTTLHHIFKSMIVKGPKQGQLAIVVLPGDFHIDFKAVCEVLDWGNYKKLKLENSEKVIIEKIGYPPGGIPPFGHRQTLPVIVDSSMLAIAEGYGGGGRYEYMVKIAPAEIIRVTNAKVAAISKEAIELAAQPLAQAEQAEYCSSSLSRK